MLPLVPIRFITHIYQAVYTYHSLFLPFYFDVNLIFFKYYSIFLNVRNILQTLLKLVYNRIFEETRIGSFASLTYQKAVREQ